MNRDNLRFRAWCEKFKVYAPINGSFSIPGEPHNIAFDPVHISADGRLYEVNNYDGREVCQVEDVTELYTIERCTGLKDKNGKLIYEGDVVHTLESWSGSKREFNVIYCDKEYGFLFVDHFKNTKALFAFLPEELEIIGNIHEMEVTN